ncbi:MAG: hypothetical protein MZU97_26115 [Bacillus subtilis]|nr:hypothetical protein [Bacillus subtilis]
MRFHTRVRIRRRSMASASAFPDRLRDGIVLQAVNLGWKQVPVASLASGIAWPRRHRHRRWQRRKRWRPRAKFFKAPDKACENVCLVDAWHGRWRRRGLAWQTRSKADMALAASSGTSSSMKSIAFPATVAKKAASKPLRRRRASSIVAKHHLAAFRSPESVAEL